jgi:hypothetical protein
VHGDLLPNFVKPAFADSKTVDQKLLAETASKQFGSSGSTFNGKEFGGASNVSTASMNAVSAQGSVETFPLVHPADTNDYTGVYIYLDEVGMLKKLPLNSRAQSLAGACGFNPPPAFYGDVFVGRVKTRPTMSNSDFSTESGDTSGGSEWIKRAISENLAWQQALNQATGKSGELQPSNKGSDGFTEVAESGAYSWKQEDDSVELVIKLPDGLMSNKKYVSAKFMNQSIVVSYDKEKVLDLPLYARIDVDGCTWTLEDGDLVVSLEKADPAAWPRIEK